MVRKVKTIYHSYAHAKKRQAEQHLFTTHHQLQSRGREKEFGSKNVNDVEYF